MITPAGVVTTLAGSGASGNADGMGAAASFSYPQGVAVDGSGNVYVADYGNNEIRKITAGMVTTVAGDGNAGTTDALDTAARFNDPTGVAVDAAGNIYVADEGNNEIRKITPGGNVTTLAGNPISGSANATGAAASFNGPTGIALDATGNIYVADYGNNQIRKVSTGGAVTSLITGSAGSTTLFNRPYGVAVDAAGNVYVANYENSTILKINKP